MKYVLALVALAFAQPVQAAFPERPIRIIVGFAAGSAADLYARHIGGELAVRLKATVIVENKAGADGMIAIKALTQSPPDGYTLQYITEASFERMAEANKTPLLDRYFSFVTSATSSGQFLIVSGDSSIQNVGELIRSKPKTYGHGDGSGEDAAKRFVETAHLPIVGVPYRGEVPLIQDMVGGHINFAFVRSPVVRALPEGRVRVLAVTSRERFRFLPQIQTMLEIMPPLGYKGFAMRPARGGIVGPYGMDPAVVNTIGGEVGSILRGAKMKALFETLWVMAIPSTPEEYRASVIAGMEEFLSQ